MNDIVQYEPQTAVAIRAHVNLIQEVMQGVMKEGTHYGKIPGTPKPSLWKPGAEVLAATFRIAVSYRVEDLSGSDFVRYRVVAVGTHQTSGTIMGEGLGECSSMEEKYKWRKAASNREFDAATEDRRRIKYGYDRNERREYEIKQVRTESADVANTIVKMACKRAQVAMTLNVVAASDIFTQDIEDLPEELRPDDDPAPKTERQKPAAKKTADPERKIDPAQKITPGHEKILTATAERATISTSEICKKFGIEKLSDLPFAKLNEALAWIQNPA